MHQCIRKQIHISGIYIYIYDEVKIKNRNLLICHISLYRVYNYSNNFVSGIKHENNQNPTLTYIKR